MRRSTRAVLVLLTGFAGCAAPLDGDTDSETESSLSAGTPLYNFGTLTHPGACMDVRSSGTANGTQIQEWWCNGTGAQRFAIQDLGGGVVSLVNSSSNKCVDVNGWGTANGTKVQLWDCFGASDGAQTFWQKQMGNGLVSFVNTNSNKCLDVAGNNPADGTVVQLWDCNGTNAQLWNPTVVGSVSGGSTSTPPPASSCNAQKWQAGTYYATGSIVVYNGNTYIATHDNPGYDPTISTWYWSPYSCTGSTTNPPPASGGTGFERAISRSTFESLFPSRNSFYTYDGLVEATKTYPAFASTGTADDQKREVAAFLANVNHETGGLVYIEEIVKGDYCSSSGSCPCAPGKQYFGRGPLQLSWNYNYCAASQSIFGDQEVLRQDPDRVARDARVAWATGLFFWMTSTGAGSQTCHNAMVNGNNFGATIQTINGSIECGGRAPASVQNRVDAYLHICQVLGVSPGGNTGC